MSKLCSTLVFLTVVSGILFARFPTVEFIIPWYGENIYFTMTVPVAGLTHTVLLPMNVTLVKECKESDSPTPKK